MRRIVTLGTIALLAAPAASQRIFVDAGASAGGDGSTWAKAYDRLELALGRARTGSEVWVANGVYRGGFVVPAGVALLGGFATGDQRVTQRAPRTNPSILDGGGTQRVIALGDRTLLDGFTVRNGNTSSVDGGGGALVKGVRATITGCLFTENRASPGAALHVTGQGDVRLQSSVFWKNRGVGHVIDFLSSSGFVTNIVVWDNVSNGLHFHQGSSPRIFNSVFGKNLGRGICHISANDTPVVESNLFWNNAVALYHYRGRDFRSLADLNRLAYAKNNLEADPAFVDPGNGDFRLKAGSPAVDAGTVQTGGALGVLGHYGQSRLLDGDLDGRMLPDVGAAEYSNATLVIGGNAMPGGTLVVRLAGPSTLVPLMLLGTDPAQLLVDPFGYVQIDVLRGFFALPWVMDRDVKVPLPSTLTPGTAFVFQGLALGKGAGNGSNGVDLRIR